MPRVWRIKFTKHFSMRVQVAALQSRKKSFVLRITSIRRRLLDVVDDEDIDGTSLRL